MIKAKILLNSAIRENYAFFCPQSGLHLDVVNPVGFTDRVTPSILRGLKGHTLVDVDNLIDIENGCFNVEPLVEDTKIIEEHLVEDIEKAVELEEKIEVEETEEVVVEETEEVEEVAVEEKATKKKNKKKDEK